MMKNHQKFKQFILKNPSLIHKLTIEGIGHFMLFCMSHLFKYQFGIFQIYMMFDTENEIKHLACPTFPDSYAEEILMYSYVIWGILGIKKFTNCVIVCGTREKAKEVYTKFENEFLNNSELKKFNHKVTKTSCDGWNIFVPGFNARISVLSYPMFPSRIRHKRRSPDIVICCDLEDSFTDNRSITSWMSDQLYDSRHFYQKTITFGTINKKDNIFEDIRTRGTLFDDRRKKLNVTIAPCPLFGEEKECFWKKRYSEKEIQEMLKNWDNKEWQQKYLLHTYQIFKVPRKYFNDDGTCNVDEYKKYLKDNPDSFFDNIFHGVAEMQQADPCSMLKERYKFYGTGIIIKYEAV